MLGTAHERHVLSESAWLDYWPASFAKDEDEYLEGMQAEIAWRQEVFRIFGKEVLAPRKIAWHGDTGASYRYTGVSHAPCAWTPTLSQLRERTEAATGLHFNSVLANLYRSGSDGMGWHADDEKEVGPTPEDRHIASLSFGEPRRFILRHKQSGSKHEFTLGRGDLLVMRGTTQSEFKHSLPKTRKPLGARVNLTFRWINS